MAHTNSGVLIGCPTENDVSPLPLKSALNVNIVIGTGYLIRSIYLSIYRDSSFFLTNAKQRLLHLHAEKTIVAHATSKRRIHYAKPRDTGKKIQQREFLVLQRSTRWEVPAENLSKYRPSSKLRKEKSYLETDDSKQRQDQGRLSCAGSQSNARDRTYILEIYKNFRTKTITPSSLCTQDDFAGLHTWKKKTS